MLYSATITTDVRWRKAVLISGFVALAAVWAYAIFCVYGFYRILAAQEVSLERFVLCCAPISVNFLVAIGKFEV